MAKESRQIKKKKRKNPLAEKAKELEIKTFQASFIKCTYFFSFRKITYFNFIWPFPFAEGEYKAPFPKTGRRAVSLNI